MTPRPRHAAIPSEHGITNPGRAAAARLAVAGRGGPAAPAPRETAPGRLLPAAAPECPGGRDGRSLSRARRQIAGRRGRNTAATPKGSGIRRSRRPPGPALRPRSRARAGRRGQAGRRLRRRSPDSL